MKKNVVSSILAFALIFCSTIIVPEVIISPEDPPCIVFPDDEFEDKQY